MTSDAPAWSRMGHETVAHIAERRLSPTARKRLQPLLRLAGVEDLAGLSFWADEHRSPTTARWHFVNLPAGTCTYVAKRDCHNSQCLVGGIKQQIDVLADHRRADADRLKALRYVVHLVGDAAQPLHAGRAEDKGGNRYQVSMGAKGTNLHRLWDGEILRQTVRVRPAEYAKQLSVNLTPVRPTSPVAWIETSCRIVSNPKFYPPHRLPASYVPWAKAIIDQQLIDAGGQLAGVLNAAL